MSLTTPAKTNFWIICKEKTELTQKLEDTIARWRLPGVRARVGHQISLSVADSIAHADYAIFVTLSETPCPRLQVTPIDALQTRVVQSPATLLNTLRRRHGCAPQAWWFQLPTTEILSQGIKPVPTEQALSQALNQIEVFVRNYHLHTQALHTEPAASAASAAPLPHHSQPERMVEHLRVIAA